MPSQVTGDPVSRDELQACQKYSGFRNGPSTHFSLDFSEANAFHETRENPQRTHKMPLITESYDSLPYIDNEPTAAQRAAAEALITASLSTILDASTHDLLPSLPASSLTPLLESEFARHASKTRITGIDLTRYEALDPPSTSPDSDEKSPETLDLWRATLASAYTSREYLAGRTKKLEELNGNGKEEWLAGNEELVAVLKGLEEELAQKKEEIDLVVVARRNAQEAVAGELTLLEDGWKKGVGRVLETEVAAEGVRGQILDARRGGAL